MLYTPWYINVFYVLLLLLLHLLFFLYDIESIMSFFFGCSECIKIYNSGFGLLMWEMKFPQIKYFYSRNGHKSRRTVAVE